MSTTDPETKRRPRRPLTDAQEAEIIRLYGFTERAMADIAQEFNVGTTYPYRVLERREITWRRGSKQSFNDYLNEHPSNLINYFDAQNKVVQHNDYVPPQPPADIADLTGVLSMWSVSIRENFTVAADSIDGALFAARKLRPDARITAIEQQP